MEAEKIKNIILDYCEVGQMDQESLDEMVEKIKQAILNELEDAEMTNEHYDIVSEPKDHLSCIDHLYMSHW